MTIQCNDVNGTYPGTHFFVIGGCSAPVQGPYAGANVPQTAGQISRYTCPVGSRPVNYQIVFTA